MSDGGWERGRGLGGAVMEVDCPQTIRTVQIGSQC